MDNGESIKSGDLVEVVRNFPWSTPETRVGRRIIVENDPYELDKEFYPESDGVGSLGFDPGDPEGMWFGGEPVPVSCVRLVQRSDDILPDPRELASEVGEAILGMQSDLFSPEATGKESDDGLTRYVIGRTDAGVRISFLVRIGAIDRQG